MVRGSKSLQRRKQAGMEGSMGMVQACQCKGKCLHCKSPSSKRQAIGMQIIPH